MIRTVMGLKDLDGVTRAPCGDNTDVTQDSRQTDTPVRHFMPASRYLALLLSTFWLATSVGAQPEGQSLANGYSVGPLRTPPVFTEMEIETETRRFLAWLEANGPKLTREQMSGPREHAYYLIGEHIRHIHAQSGTVDPPAALGLRDLNSQHGFNATMKLHSEIVSWEDTSGAYLVMYSGMDGTYQANRPHFIDFLRSVKTAERQLPTRAAD